MPDTVPAIGGVPEYDRAVDRFVVTAVDALASEIHPILKGITRHTVGPDVLPSEQATSDVDERGSESTRASSAPRRGTERLMQAQATVSTEQTITGSLEDLYVAVDQMADQMGSQMVRQMIEVISEVTEETGNVVSAGGRPVDFDLLYEALEGLEISFDDQGNPVLPTLLVPPSTGEQLRRLPPPTPEQTARLEALMKRKWEEVDARRRRGGLS